MVFKVVKRSPIKFRTITKTMISPAKVDNVDISSLPACFKTCPIIAVKIPMAAILNIISTSTLASYKNKTKINSPAIMPSLIDKEPYFLLSFIAEVVKFSKRL